MDKRVERRNGQRGRRESDDLSRRLDMLEAQMREVLKNTSRTRSFERITSRISVFWGKFSRCMGRTIEEGNGKIRWAIKNLLFPVTAAVAAWHGWQAFRDGKLMTWLAKFSDWLSG